MKHLQECLIEAKLRNICESSGGFNKYFESPEEAFKYIEQNGYINKYKLNLDIIKKLYKLSNGEVPFTIDESNKEIKLRRFFQDNPELLDKLGNFDKSKNRFKFIGATASIKIGDGCFSKKSKQGANTEPQELLFCDMINNSGNIDLDKYLSKYKLDNTFKHSAEQQYNRIKEFIDNDKYFAFRPANDKSELNKKLTQIYNDKKVFHDAKVSYITPADVYVIKSNKIKEVEEVFDNILEAFNKADDKTDYDVMFKDCKQKFVTLFNEKIFIPVSLKKIPYGKGHQPEILNINEYTVDVDQKNYSLKLLDSGFIGLFQTKDGTHIKFNFRSNQQNIYPLTFEFNKKGDGGAVGKFKTFVESYIELSPIKCKLPTVNEFYKEYKENKSFDIKKFYKEKITLANKINNFEDPKYDNNKLSQIESNDKSFYILVVCLLFIEFLYKLYDKNSEINEFFIFIEDCYMASKKITKYSLPYLLIK